MGFIKKHLQILVPAATILLYLFTRIYNILAIPIFTDEAIYVRWAQIAGTDPKERFISLTDGKQPTFVWLSAFAMRIIRDPLLAGRLVSVFAGLGSLVGIYVLTTEIFKNRKTGIIAGLIYLIYPFSMVYDKLALYDSLVSMFIIWSLYFEILLVRRIRLDIALILGMIMGGGMLTKTSNDFALILLPFSLLLFNFKEKLWKKNLLKWAVLALISVVIANVIYSILRLSPYFYIIAQKNATFVYPFREWLTHPFTFFAGNIRGLSGWLIEYLTIPFALLIVSAFFVDKKNLRKKIFLFVWFISPFMVLALFGKVIYPRYILFMTMPLLVLGAYSIYVLLSKLKSNSQKFLVLLAFISVMLWKDYFILTDISKAPIPASDRFQLIESWPSGVGVKETINFLYEKSKTGKIYVGTEGTFGLMPYSLEIYLKDNPNIKTVGFWPMSAVPPKEVLDSAKKIPTYFVFYQPCSVCPATGVAPKSWPVSKVFQIKKQEVGSFYTLYKINQ